MVESKAWKWEIVPDDDKLWNTPSAEMYYLSQNWKDKGFKEFLDVGCGFGRHSIFMAEQGFNVYAFDLSDYVIEKAKQKAKDKGVNLKKCVVADMLDFPIEDESIDALLAFHVISHTDTIGFKKILSEIRRVLKEDGECYFTIGSKESYWFNNPDCIYVDENTKIRVEDGPENGIPHFYIGDEDCKTLFNDFTIIEIKNERILTEQGTFSSHYHIWLKK